MKNLRIASFCAIFNLALYNERNDMNKKIFKPIIVFISLIFVALLGYAIYVLLSFHRIPDNVELNVQSLNKIHKPLITTNYSYRIASFNIGFGAYSPEYSFFMDGGTESWAFSENDVNKNIQGAIDSVNSLTPDFYIFQEVDLNSTRSYHINEMKALVDGINTTTKPVNFTFAINYDSPFLLYPITQPHGKSEAGVLTVTPVEIQSAIRRSLPVENAITRIIDLDRCYSKNYFNVDNGKQLVIFNIHLSAYTTDPSTAENQIIMLNDDIMAEYNAGNYVIAGGDMNKDFLIDSSKYFNTEANDADWAKPFPLDLLDDSLILVAPIDKEHPVPSCRNANEPYTKDSFVLTIDGFIVSPNITVDYANVMDTDFAYSDHNPIYMDFTLN